MLAIIYYTIRLCVFFVKLSRPSGHNDSSDVVDAVHGGSILSYAATSVR
jgi:hypothetical protein